MKSRHKVFFVLIGNQQHFVWQKEGQKMGSGVQKAYRGERKKEVLLIPTLSAYILILITLCENTWAARPVVFARWQRLFRVRSRCFVWHCRNCRCWWAREGEEKLHAAGMLTTARLTLHPMFQNKKGKKEEYAALWNIGKGTEMNGLPQSS